jgi:signal transduction histidine kinase
MTPDQAARQNMATFLDAALAQVSDGTILLDGSQRIISINSAAVRMLELEGQEFAGRLWGELTERFPNHLYLRRALMDIQESVQQPGTCQISLPLATVSGRTLLLSAYPLPEVPEPIPLHGWKMLVLRDIAVPIRAPRDNSQRAGEGRGHAEEATDALAALAQAIAHEIRNPVMVIGGFARILQRHHPQLEYLNEIILNSQRLEALVQEVTDYASLPPVRFQDEDPILWLQELITSFEPEAQTRHVNLVFTHSWPEGIKLRFDLLLMRKVLRIIFENALEAMKGGLGQISVHLQRAGNYAQLEMIDTGEGIEPHHLPFVFDPFFTTKPKALGMGLTKAERILAKHGGRLEIAPAEQRGTRVRLWLPLESCGDLPQAEIAAAEEALL